MANATAEKPAASGRIFVAKKHVGPFPVDHPFSESEFRRLAPIPDTQAARDQINPETYHDELLEYHISSGAIVEDPDAKPRKAPLGPMNNSSLNDKNAGIKVAAQNVADARIAHENRRELDKKEFDAAHGK